MTIRSDIATETFLSGYSCAQSVLYSFCDEAGLHPDTALKIACGFGAGIARRQEICGAVTGGIMVLGLKYGRGEEQDLTAMEDTYAKVHELIRRFEDRHGTCSCLQLLGGCNVATEEGRDYFDAHDLINHICKPCVQTVISILEDMTKEPPNQPADNTT